MIAELLEIDKNSFSSAAMLMDACKLKSTIQKKRKINVRLRWLLHTRIVPFSVFVLFQGIAVLLLLLHLLAVSEDRSLQN